MNIAKLQNPVIKKAINICGGTQSALALKAGVSQNTIWKLLTGTVVHPKYTTAVKLEKATDGFISRYEFMTGSQEGSSTPEQDSVEMKRFDTADNSAELRRLGE